MKRKLVVILACILFGVSFAMAQTRVVSGTVFSEEDGAPIVGASVLVEGTSTGTITDIDGNFTLSRVPATAKNLKISFIGLQTQVVRIKDNLKVYLKSDAELLDEVMVVAYGTVKKATFTGAASTVKGDELSKLQVSSLSKALEGAAPGVQVVSASGQPGENAAIRIRGIGSFSASSAPLYVVDGMPYEEKAVNAINPADIESVSILKDAASASLYGSRAANGVVMITTKQGKEEKTRISFNARLGVNTRGVPEYDIMKDQGEFVLTTWHSLYNKIATNPNADTTKPFGLQASENLIGSLGYNPYIGVKNDEIVSSEGVLTSAMLRHNDNWADEVLRNGFRQEYYLSVQGGNKNTQSFLSIGYLNDEGILRNTEFERFSARANVNHTVNKYIDVAGSLSYSRGEKKAGQSQGASLTNYANAFMFTQRIAPIYPVYAYDENGNSVYDDNGDRLYDFGDGVYSSRLGGFAMQNPASNSKLDVHTTLNDNFTGRGNLNFNLYEGLKLSVNMGYDLMNQIRTDHMNQLHGDAAKVGGRTYKYNNRTESLTVNQLLSYAKSFGLHNLDALIGHESYSFKYAYQFTHKYNFFALGNHEFNNAIIMSDMDSYTDKHKMDSYLGRINYDYNAKYYLSLSGRIDKSSKFHPDHRKGTFWSIGGSWRLTQEEFLKDVEWLSNLKLKMSYGTQGNDGILTPGGSMVYQPYLKQYSVSNNNDDFSIIEVYRGNKELTWETSENFNLGIESSFFDNRLNFEFDFFNKKTKDMLYNMPYPISSGISYIPMNLLNMKNTGIEFSLSGTPIKTQDFSWEISLNGSHYKNKITKLPNDKKENGIVHGTGSLFRLKEGVSIYEIYTYEYAGVDPETGASLWYTDPKDDSGNIIEGGKRVTTDNYEQAARYEQGSTLPDFQGAISTTLNYKGFDFTIAGNFQLGGKIYDSMYASFMHSGSSPGGNFHKDVLNAWSPTNKSSNIPIMNGSQNANALSSRFFISASYFNLRTISLGYTFPSNWLKSLALSDARIYLSADNVAMFSKRKGLDPRQYTYGYSAANYSAIRSISLGVNLTF